MIESRDNKTDFKALVANGLVAAHQFWTWWMGELHGMLPASWRNAMDAGNSRLLVAFEDEQMVLGVLERDQLENVVRVGVDEESPQALVQDYCSQNQLNANAAVLRLGRNQAVIKNLSFPRAVEDGLASMLNFEMDRHTPFSAKDVFFTQRVVSRDRAAEKIAVELVVVPKRSAARLIERLADAGITASSMVVGLRDGALGDGELVTSADLLTGKGKARNRSAIRQSRRRLELAVVILAALALLVPAVHHGLVERSLQQEVDIAKAAAARAQDARRQLLELVQPGEEFMRLRSSTPLAIAVLNEVTRVVPDDTWLDRVELDDGLVRLQGESAQAAALLALFEDSDMFSDARFSSSVTRNARSERDRFAIEASFSRQETP